MALEQSKSKIFAYDIHKKIETKGEAFNEEAINLSIENILSTMFGERIFLLEFGSPLFGTMFENLNEENGEELLDKVIQSIEKWEDRIFIFKDRAEMQILYDDNTLILTIPYSIIQNNIRGTFKKKIVFSQ